MGKHTGDLLGYIDLGKVLNSTTLKKADSLAFHVLVFLIRSIVNPNFYFHSLLGGFFSLKFEHLSRRWGKFVLRLLKLLQSLKMKMG